jgi:leukotriene-A4 hydrolase
MRHFDLDLHVDFDSRTLRGSVEHQLEPSDRPEAVLHTRDLNISSAEVLVGESWRDASLRLDPRDEVQGETLHVAIPSDASRLRINYRTSPEATGLQWLDPAQTAGGLQPFVYSQGQSIHNRSWIPCFDDPARRITFSAVLRVPNGLRAVMAAEDISVETEMADGIFRYHMPQPIPSYLVAMAVGDLVFEAIGSRTGVWTEPSMLATAASELSDTERMVEAVEEMFGAYRWGRYDVIVLPPSFPLGGMENPRLTFATPTILAGDKSLVALIAHELAHSWSGNLVTNETWNDFWLNEGFTVYLERRIQEKLYGRARSEMEAMIGRSRLEDTLEELGRESRDTWLEMDLGDRHPDDSMTDIPYEKGYLLLRLMEESFGRDRFDEFLRSYFDAHAFETMTTARFLDYLERELFTLDADAAAAIDLPAWIHGPGIPANAPVARSDAFARVEACASAYLAVGETPTDTESWNPLQWIHFLRGLPRGLETGKLSTLDAAFSLTQSENAEILCEWLKLAISSDYHPAYARADSFLHRVGRRKFVQPLFEELVKTPEGKARAKEIYATSRKTYHSMTTVTVDQILAD